MPRLNRMGPQAETLARGWHRGG